MVLRPCGSDYGAGGTYADCYPQTGGGGHHHHFYESIKSGLESFRLQAADEADRDDCFSGKALNYGDGDNNNNNSCHNDDADTSSSIASKKRIDSMFDNKQQRAEREKTTAAAGSVSSAGFGKKTRSDAEAAAAASGGRRARSLTDGGEYSLRDHDAAGPVDQTNKNTVQEKIEKMFAEISSSELDTDVSMDSAAVAAGGNKYHVRYIGCAGLAGKISSLEGLQRPVRDMYFGYRNDLAAAAAEEPRDFSGLLEISAAGLTIRYRDARLCRTVHRTDPFASIAVWAALKLVCRRRASPSADYEYAFLPLIADPDGSDKAPLFQPMDAGDRARMAAAGDDHSPVFAVVTRNAAAAGKRLQCHGFACESENDALLMAANLYGALVTAMSSSVVAAAAAAEAEREAPAKRRVIRQRNGFASMSSTAGSSIGDEVALLAPALPPPRPPPRRNNKKSTASSSSSAAAEVCSDAKTFRMTVGQPPSLRRGVCQSSSGDVSAAAAVTTSARSGGDILTKVAIPRSGSFLSANGLACTKYSWRTAGCSGIGESAADRRRRRSSGGSVMGFSDMFDELRAQEGLHNVDDILNAIINVEGMSFNDLKPIYREFLMKLALTLTKDELYQRTKAIMLEQKRKRNKTGGGGRGRALLNEKLRNALQSGGRAAKSKIGAVLLPDFCKRQQKRYASFRKRRCSCSGTAAKGPLLVAGDDRRKLERKNRRAVGKRSAAPKQQQTAVVRRYGSSSVCSTSDDSEFFAAALRRRLLQQQQARKPAKTRTSIGTAGGGGGGHKGSGKASSGGSKAGGKGSGISKASGRVSASEMSGCLHRASSGYFSCSECSAAGDDKCYCGGADPISLASCSCDSDSCADSDKCYCGRRPATRTIFDELKSRGFAASESSCASRADSPGTAWKKNELLLAGAQELDRQHVTSRHSGGKWCGGVEPSKSLEYLRMSSGGRPQHYSSVAKRPVDRMRVYNNNNNTASSSSSSSSLSAATVYSSSCAPAVLQRGAGDRRQRRSGSSSGSDNLRAIDYSLFAGPRNGPRDGGRRMNRSYSSEAVNLSASGGCHVYHQARAPSPARHHRRPTALATATATRRHSVHDGHDLVASSFFKSDIENSLGYYP